jgi:hypothetical protein
MIAFLTKILLYAYLTLIPLFLQRITVTLIIFKLFE